MTDQTGTSPASDGEENQSGAQIKEIICDKGYAGKS